jgi:hypothetical protein
LHAYRAVPQETRMLSDRSPFKSSPRRTETITKVPNNAVEQVRQDFQDSGAPEVVIKDEGDGTSTVIAIFPN